MHFYLTFILLFNLRFTQNLMQFIDLRSDTVTQPTQQMRQAILTIQYGDWAYGEDEVVNQLQKRVAQLFNKQDAAFVISGVFGNQVTMHSVGHPGEEIIVGDKSHLVRYQNGSLGLWSRLMARTVPTDQNGFILPQTLRKYIRKLKDSQAPKTTILSLQNPTCEGRIYPQQMFNELCEIGKKQGLHVHVDGARIFHVSFEKKIHFKQLTEKCDTVMFCFSKALGAPLGSIVVGKKEVIQKIRVNRKRIGGILRKPGMVVQSCNIALDNWQDTINKADLSAKLLSQQLKKLPFIELVQDVDINMVFFRFIEPNEENKLHLMKLQKLRGNLLEKKIKCPIGASYKDVNRFVTHHYIGVKEISDVVQAIKQFYDNSK